MIRIWSIQSKKIVYVCGESAGSEPTHSERHTSVFRRWNTVILVNYIEVEDTKNPERAYNGMHSNHKAAQSKSKEQKQIFQSDGRNFTDVELTLMTVTWFQSTENVYF